MNSTSVLEWQVASRGWLQKYYFVRFAFAASWVASALAIGRSAAPVAAVLLVLYPAWDAAANYLDAHRSGGLGRNLPQVCNVLISVITAFAVALAIPRGMGVVLGVFGIWAVLAGLSQLVTGVRRWKTHGAQWAMILSGAQSALAGVFFAKATSGPALPSIIDITPYAGLGAFYFLVSASWLAITKWQPRLKRSGSDRKVGLLEGGRGHSNSP